MSRFKEALERGKEARRRQVEHARNAKTERDAPMADFDAQAKAWLNDVVVASLEAAKADVAGEVTIDIDTGPHRRVKASTPSIRFQIYRKRGEKTVRRTFTVSVQVSGEVSVSAPGIVAKEVGNIGDRSDERFRNLVAELIEDAAKGT
jgi:lipoprotein-anchoring transpeptidase ErfK/SrfK